MDTVLNNGKQSQVLIDVAGPRLALASPVLGPSRQVFGILMWVGDPTQTPPAEPPAQAWEWHLGDRVSPRLVSNHRSARTATMTDWLSGFTRATDAARVAHEMRTATVGFRGVGEWVDVGGTVHRYAQRCVATFDGPRMLVVSVDLPDHLGADDPDLVARRVIDATATAGDVAPALVDTDSSRVIAWLSAARPQLPPEVLSGLAPAPAPALAQLWDGTPDMTLGFYPR